MDVAANISDRITVRRSWSDLPATTACLQASEVFRDCGMFLVDVHSLDLLHRPLLVGRYFYKVESPAFQQQLLFGDCIVLAWLGYFLQAQLDLFQMDDCSRYVGVLVTATVSVLAPCLMFT